MKKTLRLLALVLFMFLLVSCGKNEIVISFETNGGTAIEDLVISADDTSVDLPSTSKEGYVFEGWYIDQDLSDPFSIDNLLDQSEITVYAKWGQDEAISFTITFDTKGGNDIAPMTVEQGATLVKPDDPIKEGYTFDGWLIDNDVAKPYDFTLLPDTNITLSAKWVINQYTIIFDTFGGSTIDDVIYDFHASTVKPDDPVKEGYTFDGWYEDDNLTMMHTFGNMPSEDITLYAKWKVEEVKVSVDIYLETLDHMFVLDETIDMYEEKDLTYTYEPQDILGFIFDQDHELNVLSVVAGSNDSIKVYYLRKTITISFETNEGLSLSDLSGMYGDSFELPDDPVREGYTFVGWYQDEDLSQVLDEQMFDTSDMILYAKWEKEKSTLVFDTMGGNTIEDYHMLDGLDMTLPTPVKEGYSFIGWYKTNTYDELFEDTTMPLGYTVLYAKWDINTYTLSFETNGGTIIDDQSYTYMAELVLPTDPTKEGYLFSGWYEDEALDNLFSSTVMSAQDIAIYAKWIDLSDESTIAFQLNHTPYTDVTVSGIVYAKQEIVGFGYYIYDETGFVFVSGDQNEVEINQLVTVSGIILTNGYVKYIANVTAVTIDASDQVEKDSKLLSIADIAALDNEEIYMIHDLFEAEGILYENENGQLEIVDINTLEHVMIYDMFTRYDTYEDLKTMLLSKVSFTYVLIYYADTYMIGIVDYESTPLTFDEIVDIYADIDVEAFYVEEDTFTFKTIEDLGFVDITYEAVGDNASYFNQNQEKFNSIDEEEIIIDFEFRITDKNDETIFETIIIPITVKAIESDDVSDLLDGEVGQTFMLDVIVVSISEEYVGEMILKDDTGMVVAQHYQYLQIGDRVLIEATKQLRGNQVYLSYDDASLNIIRKLSTGKDLGKVPTAMTLAEIDALDVTNEHIYGQYVEIQGFLITSDLFSYESDAYLSLTDGNYKVAISQFGDDAFSRLYDYMYSDIIIKGFISSDGTNLNILYEGLRSDVKIHDYTDEETVEAVKQGFLYQIEGIYIPPMVELDMLPYNLVYGTNISWEVSDDSKAYFDMETQRFLPTYEDVNIEVIFTVEKGEAVISFTVEAVLSGIELTSFDDVLNSDTYETYFIKGVITYWHPYFSYITDENGKTLLVKENIEQARIGDEVVLSVMVNKYHDALILTGSYFTDDILVEILSYDHDVDITYVETDMADIVAMDESDVENYYQPINLVAKIVQNYSDVRLETIDGYIDLNVPDDYILDQLLEHVGQYVRINGLICGYDEAFELMYTGQTDDLEIVTYTDEEKADLIKALILNRFENPLIAQSSFDFNEGQTLFNDVEVTIDYTILEGQTDLLDFDGGYINDVDTATNVKVGVVITCEAVELSFTVDVNVVPYADDTSKEITTIADALLDVSQTYTIYGTVLGLVIDDNQQAVFLIEDETGVIRVKISTDHFNIYYTYTNVQIYFTGIIDQSRGYDQMEAFEMNHDFDTLEKERTFESYTLEDINILSLTDATTYGKPVYVTGDIMVEYINDIPHYYIVDGNHKVAIATTQLGWTTLNRYVGYHVGMYTFVFGEHDAFDLNEIHIMYNEYANYNNENMIHLEGYSDEEVVDIVSEALYNQYIQERYVLEAGYGIPSFYMPYEVEPFDEQYTSIEITSKVIEGQEFYTYNEKTNRNIFIHVEEDQVIIIEVKVSYNGIEKTFEAFYDLNGYTLNTLEDLYRIEEGTQEIVLEGIYLYSLNNHHYFYVEDEILQIDVYLKQYISQDMKVLIMGKKDTIEGVATYTYHIVVIEEAYNGFGETPQTVTMMELYHQDESDPLYKKFLNIKGEVGYDSYLEQYTLSDQGKMVYLRTESYNQEMQLSDYVGYRISINVCIPYDLYIRDEYMVLDIYSKDPISLEDLTDQEELNQIAKVYQEAYDGMSVYSGEPIDLMHEPGFYQSHITYRVANEEDAMYFDDTYTTINIVDEPVTIDIIGTVINSLDETKTTEFIFSMTILPHDDITIESVYRSSDEDIIHTTGIVVDAYYYNGLLDWMVIDDGSNLLYAKIKNMYLFNYEDIDIEVGDEVRIVGVVDQYGAGVKYLKRVSAIKVISEAQAIEHTPMVYTFEDMLYLDHVAIENALTYVKISGTLTLDGYYLNIESNDINFLGTQDPYSIKLYPVYNTDIYGDLSDLIGEEVEVEGYLHFENSYYTPYWTIIFTNIE